MLEYKTVSAPRWLDAKKTKIICDVEFPDLGGVFPFVADPTDSEEHGRQLFAELTAGKHGPVAPYQAPPAPTLAAPETLPDVKVFGALAKRRLISETEALAAVASGALPEKIEAAVAALPKEEAFDARLYLAGSAVLARTNPHVLKIMHLAFNLDGDGVVELFAEAARAA